MAVEIPFRVKIDGGDASRHELPAYDGFMALAGFSLSLSLVTNYVETGKIRRRGDFVGRSSVKALPIEEGSVLTDFIVRMAEPVVLGSVASGAAATSFLYDVFKRTIDRNLGNDTTVATDQLAELERTKYGDLEALVAATEPSVRQAHTVIGDGAKVINMFGGTHLVGHFDIETKAYVEGSYTDNTIREKNVSVASFNVNSGYGGVFDEDLGRVVPVKLTKQSLARAKAVLSWGLDQYANGTGNKISLKYFTVLALDKTVKQYIVVDANIPGR